MSNIVVWQTGMNVLEYAIIYVIVLLAFGILAFWHCVELDDDDVQAVLNQKVLDKR